MAARLNKYEKISFMQIPHHDEDLLKFSLKSNGKTAIEQYGEINIPKKALLYDYCNVGLITGYRNNITVVDLDFKEVPEDDHSFIEKFGTKFIKTFNTFTVKTPSGGYHLYFKYDSEIRQTQNKLLGIDIRNDGGYVVCPPSSINSQSYVVHNNVSVKQCPANLKKWLLATIYPEPKKQSKSIKLPKEDNVISIVEDKTAYDVVITSDIITTILNKLPVDCDKKDDYRGSYTKWIHVLDACKFIGRKTEFIEWSKSTIHNNYDEDVLLKIWNSCHSNVYNFLWLLKITNVTNMYTYKRLPAPGFGQYDEINRAKLDDIYIINQNYLIKSDTGTGKTTSFRKYIKRTKQPFISITSRIALSHEQYNDFRKEGIEVYHYSNKSFHHGKNIIITPESSIILSNYDLKNYVVFMDEFDSIINHIMTSDTMRTTRHQVFLTIIRLLQKCKQFICVDADISPISKHFLDSLGVHYEFLVNIFKHYRNVKVNIVKNEQDFLNLIAGREKYLVCTDSKKNAELIDLKEKIDDPDVVIFTSDSEQSYIKLDDHNKVIFSPKIIYGLDSTMKRDVFCYYNGMTIYPSQMVQQIARCRNINEVYIFFPQKPSTMAHYEKIEDSIGQFNESINNMKFQYKSCSHYTEIEKSGFYEMNELTDELFPTKTSIMLFEDIYTKIKYRDDCYDTSKFLHLTNILSSRGFLLNEYEGSYTKLNHKEAKEQIHQQKLDNFNLDSIHIKKLNEYLKIPLDQIEEYKELFIDQSYRTKHINVCRFFFQDTKHLMDNLKERRDFDIIKCHDSSLKLKVLESMLKSIGYGKLDIGDFVPSNKKIIGYEKIQDIYHKHFRIRVKKLDLSTQNKMYSEICKVYASLFNITVSKKVRFGTNGRTRVYSIDKDVLQWHKYVYSFRKPNRPYS